MGVQKVPKNLVQRVGQRLARFWSADHICMAYVEWEPDRVSTVANSWLRRLPAVPRSPRQPLGYNQYCLLGRSVLDALIDHKTNPTDQLKRKVDAVVGREADMDSDRQEAAMRNLRQSVG